MNRTLATQIQLLEDVQALHQNLESPTLHWLEPGAKSILRHLANLPRLQVIDNPQKAQILVGNCDQLINCLISTPYILLSDESQPTSERLTRLLLKGYRKTPTRLLEYIQRPVQQQNHLKIIVITNLYPPQELGGYGRSIYDFAQNLGQMGHQVEVLTSDAPYLGGNVSGEMHVTRDLKLMGTYEGKIQLITDASMQARILSHNKFVLQQILERLKPDTALLGNLDMLGPECINQLKQHQIPCWHHYGFSDPAMLPFPMSAIPKPNTGYQPVANSHFTADSLKQALHGYVPIPVIYPGAQTHLFSDLNPPALGGCLKIAYAGLLIGAKGPHILLEALARLRNMHIPFYCEMAGGHIDDRFKEQLVLYAKSSGIESQVKLLGKLQRYELRDLFNRNQVFVFPSTWEEPFGISQVEALAAGLLVVSSGTGGAGETVHDDINGRRFRPSDSKHLSEVLHEIYLQPKQHELLRVRGRRLAQSHFDTVRETRKLSKMMIDGVKIAHSALMK